MRVLLILALLAVVLAAVWHGLRLLWRTAFPPAPQEVENPTPTQPVNWLEVPTTKWLLRLLLALLLLLVVERIFTPAQPPPRHYEPPHLENGRVVPGRFH